MLKNNKYKKIFSIWLISLIILISSIIVVGGLTRLTDSGLSITQWELFSGTLPPLNEKQWNEYFSLYKEIPQFILMNSSMNLSEFKYIFWWEYAHRVIARLIGLLFLIPFLFFIFKKTLLKENIINLVIIFFLIAIQGTVGWLMVKSGLVDDVTVDHYRLSAHLTLAFIILSLIYWFFLNFIFNSKKTIFSFTNGSILFKTLLILILLQISCGALVSGLDAARVYQTWPLMNGYYFPQNFNLNFNEPGFVQFIHRNLAYLIFFISLYTVFYIHRFNLKKIYKIFYCYFTFIFIQIILGILVLIYGFNFYFASAHQVSSIFLVLSTLTMIHMSLKS
jgi:cytochrome c oxidase assembly protein subunit 15